MNTMEVIETENVKGMPLTMYGVFCLANFANSYMHKVYSTRSAFSHWKDWFRSCKDCTVYKKAQLFNFYCLYFISGRAWGQRATAPLPPSPVNVWGPLPNFCCKCSLAEMIVSLMNQHFHQSNPYVWCCSLCLIRFSHAKQSEWSLCCKSRRKEYFSHELAARHSA